jgi:hypothetical protein
MTARCVFLAMIALLALTISSGVGQSQSSRQSVPRTQYSPMAAAQAQGHAHRPPDNWYDFLLKQFNPDDVDYGKWMEGRRRAFLEATIKNPYFPYSFWLTIWSLLVMTAYAKLRIDRARERCLTQEMLTDLYNHDLYSRQAAREAIEKYNYHIERCNRAIESGSGQEITGGISEIDDLKAKLKKSADDLRAMTSERDQLQEELKQNSAVVTDLSLRLNALSGKIDGNGATGMIGNSTPAHPSANTEQMKLINSLQQQLYAERERNKRLKGA